MGSNEPRSKNSGLATASLVLGILALVFGVIGVGAILGVLAIIFGAVSIKGNGGKSLAGIITGVIGITIAITTAYFVFAVIPTTRDNLQSSQRDTQRKNDVAVLSSDVIYRMSEDRGVLPDNDWVSDMTYKLTVITSTSDQETGAQPTTSRAIYTKGTDCDGRTGARSYSLTILLENGNTYCEGS